jgi:hypothetical protein
MDGFRFESEFTFGDGDDEGLGGCVGSGGNMDEIVERGESGGELGEDGVRRGGDAVSGTNSNAVFKSICICV